MESCLLQVGVCRAFFYLPQFQLYFSFSSLLDIHLLCKCPYFTVHGWLLKTTNSLMLFDSSHDALGDNYCNSLHSADNISTWPAHLSAKCQNHWLSCKHAEYIGRYIPLDNQDDFLCTVGSYWGSSRHLPITWEPLICLWWLSAHWKCMREWNTEKSI